MPSDLRASQLETLRFATKYPDGLGAWELVEFGPGGNSIRSAESRLERLEDSGHLRAEGLHGREYVYGLTDKGRAALEELTGQGEEGSDRG